MIPLRTLTASLIIPCMKERKIEFRGDSIPFIYARYNITWANERCIELALARNFMMGVSSERILEIGNVTPHYFGKVHTVVDKYEEGALQVDIVDYEPNRDFDLILSISTIEHIAFDENDGTEHKPEEVAKKIRVALDRCLSLLASGGKFVITVPMGYNPALDGMVIDDSLGCDRAVWFKRFPGRIWREVKKEEGLACRYGVPYPFANGIMLAE